METAPKQLWNWRIWVGFLVVIAGLFSYFFFAQFPVTRDFPWANLLIFGVGGLLLLAGLLRAFRQPQVYRGRILGSILTVLSLALVGLFAFSVFYMLRQLPPSTGAPRVGQKAPAFSLPDQEGKPVALADLSSSSRAVLLIFYRGHW